jgi:hypothetical protein
MEPESRRCLRVLRFAPATRKPVGRGESCVRKGEQNDSEQRVDRRTATDTGNDQSDEKSRIGLVGRPLQAIRAATPAIGKAELYPAAAGFVGGLPRARG